MSWVSGLFTFDANTTKAEMIMEIEECFDSRQGNGIMAQQQLVLVDTIPPFDSEEEAKDYLECGDGSKYWRQKNVGVRYRDVSSVKPTKKMIDIDRRIEETEVKLIEYAKAHSVKTFKAEFIGCPQCKSKLRRELLTGDSCPLCRTDMRSGTTRNTLSGYREKIKALQNQKEEEQKKLADKGAVRWLVAAQAYLG